MKVKVRLAHVGFVVDVGNGRGVLIPVFNYDLI